ncbi:hypothetical protein GMW39_00870 [Pectobacterium parmentieri]|uniref:hypothetical protein n=1 Tax=Pectobacterium parmentieri TaxID=1905730 RepID=UPI000D621C93|nr:hypothetical protein [Pectobacterium parmentieri]PWD66517.1 hypothetical protein DF211_01820 [Pectobacterium parmentieri]QHQ14561.1 hypothetical protein GMW39_00870 [Pectobacterium parmentieri]
MDLTEYIKKNFGGNQAAFARHMGVRPQKVQDWLNAEWIVIDNKLCSVRREIPLITKDEAENK